jgi:hypothetical protein
MYIPLHERAPPHLIVFCHFQGLGKTMVLMSKHTTGQYDWQNFFSKNPQTVEPYHLPGVLLTRGQMLYKLF